MKIESIDLSGWRSFNSEGIHLEKLNRINLIIGQNNSGKSNLFKFLYHLKKITNNNLPKNGHININHNMDNSDTWLWNGGDIQCSIKLSKSNVLNGAYDSKKQNIRLNSTLSGENSSVNLNISVDDRDIFTNAGLITSLDADSNPRDANPDDEGMIENVDSWDKFLSSMVFFDPVRDCDRESKNSDGFYFDGSKIINDLYEICSESSQRALWSDYKGNIKRWLNLILDEDVQGIEVGTDYYRVEFLRGDSDFGFLLSELGTGVSQIVMLLSYLWLNKASDLNVFVEEPESNLHPESLTRLISIFEGEFYNHSFFISTHSPTLIDCVNDDWSVYTVSKKNDGSSRFSYNDSIIKNYETLDLLGVKASQILQSNCVIWVEGPSDRVYLKKWIELVSDNVLLEGKDYSFLYFGGTVLSSFSVEESSEQFINILSTSRKSVLITDSDCSSQSDRNDGRFKAYLDKFKIRVELVHKSTFGDNKCLDDYFKVFITEGREVENYIQQDLMIQVLSTEPFIRKQIGVKLDDKKELLFQPNVKTYPFNKFDSYDEWISFHYTYNDGSSLTEKDQNNIAKSYSSRKVGISNEVVKKLNDGNFNCNNLKSFVEELVEFIKC